MQFGILHYPFIALSDLASCRYCIPMDSPRPILPAELDFFHKGTGKGKSISHLAVLEIFTLNNWFYLMSFTVPLVVIFTKFDGQIASEFVNLTDQKDEDKWERAREIAETTFQKIYLPRVLNAKHPPKAYVQLEGENDKYFFLKNGSHVVS